MASPEWGASDGPINWNKRLHVPGIPVAEFQAGNE